MEDAKIVGWFLEMRFSNTATLFSGAVEGIDYTFIKLMCPVLFFFLSVLYANLLLAVASCTTRECSK